MAKGFKHGAGGPGLNFKVIGNPQPETARENTIWVDTDRINNYYFSATQPENMAEYDVWISTGTSSTVAFSATKKNPIMVYPLSAKQYIGGAWVNVTAQSWQGGKWVDWWNGELYDAGNEFTAITGGWLPTSEFYSSGNTPRPDLVAKEAECIHLKTGSKTSVVAVTSNKVDLSNFTTLCFDVESGDGSSGSDRYGIIQAPGEIGTSSAASVVSTLTARHTLRLDIPKNTNGLYVYVSSGSRDRKIYKVWME
jgi:hypothetical protein